MKKIIIITVMLLSIVATEKAISQVVGSIDYNTFYTTLNPYGRWMDYPQYGKVWICNEPGFRPYYNSGHWEYTSYGWTWVSDYPWGWAPFHYGRWAFIDGYGWAWVPGYDWAPAWVCWGGGGDYYGWAPLSPGLSINVSIGSIPPDRWCFVPHQYINSPTINNYYVNSSQNVTIYKNVTVINNIHSSHNVRFIAGPKREDVERAAHITIQPRQISYAQKPGRTVVSNNAINIYRPGVTHSQPAPARQVNHNAATGNTNRNNTAPTTGQAKPQVVNRTTVHHHNNQQPRTINAQQHPASTQPHVQQPPPRPQPQVRQQPPPRPQPQVRPMPPENPRPPVENMPREPNPGVGEKKEEGRN
jgi:hypothetical protein